jgi:hypothetical protein
MGTMGQGMGGVWGVWGVFCQTTSKQPRQKSRKKSVQQCESTPFLYMLENEACTLQVVQQCARVQKKYVCNKLNFSTVRSVRSVVHFFYPNFTTLVFKKVVIKKRVLYYIVLQRIMFFCFSGPIGVPLA